jgi:hypothetical protein
MPQTVPVCWIDHDYDRTHASDGVSRYGAYLAGHAGLFDPWGDAGPSGITRDPVEFAAAALRVATGPVMSPGYVRWHGRVIGHAAARGEQDGRLVLAVTLACPAPARLPGYWQGWEREVGGWWVEPRDDRPVGLCRLELRWPVPTPAPPRLAEIPNLADARRAVAVLVEQVNVAARPVLADLEAGR